jgi:pimeloyl-ACP methyl ester carboxylesterase
MRRGWAWWVLMGCSGWLDPAAAGAAAPAAAIALHECRLEHPLRLSSPAARCGELRVPENRGVPGAGTIDLQLAVVPALNRRAMAAPLFLLAGGPGQSAIDLYVAFAAAFARIGRDHDIVLLDQRGTGRSAPLVCPYPEDWQQQATDALPELRRATQACLAKYGERVRYYTTSVAVQDLEEVRRALGYGRIELYAASYGTRVAELYMRRHPEWVQAAILDGVTYPEQAIGPQTPLDGERALGLIIARCREARDCATAFPLLSQELQGLRTRFGPQELPLTIEDPTAGTPQTVVFNRALLNAALRLLSYSSSTSSLLPALLHQAALGNLAPLAAQPIMAARRIGAQLAGGMQNTVICSEDEPFFGFAGVDRASILPTYQGADQLDAFREICKWWPRGPVDVDLHAALHSDIPTLLLSGEADPVTPPADAERAAQDLSRHRLVVLAGEGHGQLATGCVPRLMAQFLDHMDPRNLDIRCLAQHRAPPFFVSLTGPVP